MSSILTLSLCRKLKLRLFAVMFTLLSCFQVNATLMNTDFSSGYTSWGAEVIDQTLLPTVVDPSLFSSNFSLNANAVTLATSNTNGVENWSITLFQDVIFSPVLASQKLLLSFELSNILTDVNIPSSDFFFVQLRDLNTNDILDMTNGGMFDITSWANVNATFEFGIQDGDFTYPDSLTLSNLSVATVSVPEPSVILLFLVSFLLLATRKLKIPL